MSKRAIPTFTPADYMKHTFNWYQYCWQWWEMMAASSLTIGMRTTDMSLRARKNQVPNFAEGWRMVAEKQQALLKSAAGAAPWQKAVQQYWSQSLESQVPGAKSHTTADLMNQQFQFGKLMLQSMTATLQPFHKASTANAFRLAGKRKPR